MNLSEQQPNQAGQSLQAGRFDRLDTALSACQLCADGGRAGTWACHVCDRPNAVIHGFANSHRAENSSLGLFVARYHCATKSRQ